MERKRNWEDESRSQDREAERARSSRGLRFQDEYDLDRTRRGSGYGGGGGGYSDDREWAPGGARYEQHAIPQETYHPSWNWEPWEGGPQPERDPREARGYTDETHAVRPYQQPQRVPLPREQRHRGVLERIKELVGKGPKSYRRSDERILEDVNDRLAHGYLDASEIEVIVKVGVVTLEGSVRSKHDQRLAEDLVEDVLGVRELDNRLRVKRALAEPPRL